MFLYKIFLSIIFRDFLNLEILFGDGIKFLYVIFLVLLIGFEFFRFLYLILLNVKLVVKK